MDRLRRATPKQQGQSLMEFALVIPILLMLFMGIVDLGRFMFLYSQTVNGAREGARYGTVSGLNATPIHPQFIECENIRTAVREAFGLAVTPDQLDIAIEYDHGSGAVFGECVDDANHPDPSDIETGDRILVTITTTYSFLTPGLGSMIGPIPVTFTSARTVLVGGTVVPPGNW